MRLTAEEHGAAVARYAHVPRVAKSRSCGARAVDGKRLCTREAGHRGPHVAHGLLGRVLEVWDAPTSAAPPTPAGRVGRAALPADSRSGPTGLRGGRPAGPLETLWKRLTQAVSSLEELTFLVLFVAFVGFAAYWLMLILG